MKAYLVLAAAMLVFSISASSALAAGTVNISASGMQASYAPGKLVTGTALVSYNRLIPRTAVIQAYINGSKSAELSMYNYTNDISYYSFANIYFIYNITAFGTNTWVEHPSQAFSYSIKVNGTCGGTYCNGTGGDTCQCQNYCQNGAAYPCFWSSQMTLSPPPNSTVRSVEGLKKIADTRSSLFTPASRNSDTVWHNTVNLNQNVEVSMRESCGSESYIGRNVDNDGWVRRAITTADLPTQIQNYREGTIEKFDNSSLSPGGRAAFTAASYSDSMKGGIYKNGVYQTFSDSTNVSWDGATGKIRIYNFDGSATYMINYLPPNGPSVCAYTPVVTQGSSNWRLNKTLSGSCSYKQNYTNPEDLEGYFNPLSMPACPAGSTGCSQRAVSFSATKTYDSSGSVVLSMNSSNWTNAYTNSPDLDSIYTSSIGFGAINITSPGSRSTNTLDMKIVYGSDVLGYARFNLTVCQDSDGDGYCGTADGGGDCNDTASAIRPGATELCNGIDDNCDGRFDEGFSIAGRTLGTSCNSWNGSACAGQWACTSNGSVECNARYVPGQLTEVCGNNVDDDCDGSVDETTETVNGTIAVGCIENFKNNDRRKCGNPVGECREGYQIFMNGKWSDCYDQIVPKTETCNGKDDNCDGVIDNIAGGNSAESTRCACYGGAAASGEACNNMDDNCNGQVDENMQCCMPGDIRECGRNYGGCKPGAETCRNGQWGECVGGIQPPDVRVDSECNTIEYCADSERIGTNCICGNQTYIDGYCCAGFYSNSPCSKYNFSLWTTMAGIAILCIIGFWIIVVKVVSA